MAVPFLASFVLTVLAADVDDANHFQIKVIDEQTGRGVPLIELRTVHDLRLYTDSAGLVAFREPGLMDQEVFFFVQGHGYEFSADGFGFHGQRLKTTPGKSATMKVRRKNIAERLYRITGAGIYQDSVRLGIESPIKQPLINAKVLGSDSVQAAVFRDRIYWFWGDTTRASYPLGLFHAPGATSQLPDRGGLDPNVGIDLEYFTDEDGFAKGTCPMPGEGPTWIDGLAVVSDASGNERLFAHYLKVKPPLTVYRHGIAEFNLAKNEFEPRADFPNDAAALPGGHSFTHTFADTQYVCFAKPFPVVRVRATAEDVMNPIAYEAYTCLIEGSSEADLSVDRDEHGNVRYAWRRNTPPLTPELQKKLVDSGKLSLGEGLYNVRDVETNKKVTIHHGAVNWNEYRRRWVLIASEINGSSMLGEVWYAEADSMHGPWRFARKIVTHEKQSFYNPRRHPFFDQDRGRIVYFEGTYTHSFSGNDERTPRYEYNQMMYRLDLDDPRLVLPVAVRRNAGGLEKGEHEEIDGSLSPVLFYACDRPFENSVEISDSKFAFGAGDEATTNRGEAPKIYLVRPDAKSIPPGCLPLLEIEDPAGVKKYSIGETDTAEGRTIGFVWPTLSR